MSLFDHDRELEDAPRGDARQGGLYMHHDLVSCDDRGLVDPSYTGRFRWNGLHMYPNTVNSVELLRSFSDWADECRLLGQDVPFPWMFTISKGDLNFLSCCRGVPDVAAGTGCMMYCLEKDIS